MFPCKGPQHTNLDTSLSRPILVFYPLKVAWRGKTLGLTELTANSETVAVNVPSAEWKQTHKPEMISNIWKSQKLFRKAWTNCKIFEVARTQLQ